jgi:anti-sigma factor RsiW
MTIHPETEIVPFVRGELPPAERARVVAHVHGCAECRRAVEETRAVLALLAASLPGAPALDVGPYQAEVRARVQAHRGDVQRWWSRPVPLIASVGLAAALLLIAVQGWESRTTHPELSAVEETAIGARLDLLENYPVVERLDLLEDLDVIRQLDRLPTREG